MRVFVYEYLCGEAPSGDSVSSLRDEGWAMLSAVLEDFSRCAGVRTVTLLDPNFSSKRLLDGVEVHFQEGGSEERMFRALASAADSSLIIAPEFDDILLHRCRWVEEAGGRLLGPSSEAVRLTSDKLTLARHWIERGIPTPPIVDPDALTFPLVAKPRDGAGSQATFLIRKEDELKLVRQMADRDGWTGELILQPYIPGRAVSVAFLAGSGRLLALPAAEQHLSNDGRFHYLGGRLPLPDNLDRRARRLAERAAHVVEGLQGYFGVDLVLGEAEDGSADAAIEINPRLTTSYVGLGELAHFNLAEALLAVVSGASPPSWNWRSEPIEFRSDGRIRRAR
jgi:predicted ATP-grasp superfamily ATP-dependent carboligase